MLRGPFEPFAFAAISALAFASIQTVSKYPNPSRVCPNYQLFACRRKPCPLRPSLPLVPFLAASKALPCHLFIVLVTGGNATEMASCLPALSAPPILYCVEDEVFGFVEILERSMRCL